MRPCIVPQQEGMKKLGVGQTPTWPERLTTPPERLKLIQHTSPKMFTADTQLWVERVNHYKQLVPELKSNAIRNVMDMYTQFGGFAAALNDDPVWVMNVVSSYATNTLGIVYDRGLIGTYTDWYSSSDSLRSQHLSLFLSIQICCLWVKIEICNATTRMINQQVFGG